MMDALYVAATGMLAQQSSMDVVAHNLANANTSGYKRTRMELSDLGYQTFRLPAGGEGQMGLGAAPGTFGREMGQGTIQDTGRDLDLAIDGPGFLQVTRSDGTLAYTRTGNLQLDAEGRLSTPAGELIQPRVQIPAGATATQIAPDGRITATIGDQTREVGRIQIAAFTNPAGLEAVGDNLYAATVNSGQPQVGTPGAQNRGTVLQGRLEGSNVQIATEMIDMIFAQRAFEAASKVVSASDEMMGMANQIRR
jgi:flagellar basal-body rod protein FlgG